MYAIRSYYEMRKAGLPAHGDAKKGSVETGVQVIKKLLRVPGSMDTKLLLAKETCSPIIAEFGLYHFKTSADGTISEIIDTRITSYNVCYTKLLRAVSIFPRRIADQRERRSSSAWDKVPASTYSSSPPRGTPRAMRLTRTSRAFSISAI